MVHISNFHVKQWSHDIYKKVSFYIFQSIGWRRQDDKTRYFYCHTTIKVGGVWIQYSCSWALIFKQTQDNKDSNKNDNTQQKQQSTRTVTAHHSTICDRLRAKLSHLGIFQSCESRQPISSQSTHSMGSDHAHLPHTYGASRIHSVQLYGRNGWDQPLLRLMQC